MSPTTVFEQYPHLAATLGPARPQPAKRRTEPEPAQLHVDQNGLICDCNAASEALFAYSHSELLGQPISTLLPELRDSELWVNGQPNPHLRFLCRLGRHFRAVTNGGALFSGELYLNFLDNPGHHLVSVIVRPAREGAGPPTEPARPQQATPALRVVAEHGITHSAALHSKSDYAPGKTVENSSPADDEGATDAQPPAATVSERTCRHASQGTLILDIDGVVRYVDPTASALLAPHGEQLLGRNIGGLLPALALHPGTPGYNAAFIAFHFGHGHWIPCHTQESESSRPLACTAAFFNGGHMSSGFAVHLRLDGNGEYRAESDFRRLQDSLDACEQAAFITDADGKLVYANTRFAAALGFERAELEGRPVNSLQGRLEQLRPSRLLTSQIRDGQHGPILLDLRRKDGRPWRQEASMRPFHGDGIEPTHYIFTGNGAASRRGVLRNLERLANHDVLTGLPNRRLFLDRLNQAVARAVRHQRRFSVLYLDLDGFKEINDRQGHAAGDAILRTVGHALTRCIRAEDTVARIGGDEFVCIISDIARPEDTTTVCTKILASLQRSDTEDTATQPTEPMFLGGSIGVAVYPEDGTDEMMLLHHADQAMYFAKRGGGNRYLMFNEAMA